MAAARHLQKLKSAYPFLKPPFIISAPMRVFAGPDLAVATSRAGGLGFIGPGVKPADLEAKLQTAESLLQHAPIAHSSQQNGLLPVGVGFQMFDGDLEAAAKAIAMHRPVAAWLFVPATGQSDTDRWAARIREASPKTRIWLQVGSVLEAVVAAKSSHPPDVLVLQGIDAGGHGLKKGAGILSLLPEVSDRLKELGVDIPLVGAGGVADGRGVAAVLATGVAAGVVMGTRFLASREAEIQPGYQSDILRVDDGGQSTVRTTLFDRLQGRDDWPKQYDGRAIINASVRDDEAGMTLGENKTQFQECLKGGSNGWGVEGRLTSYVGSGVGLVRSVDSAKDIIEISRAQATQILSDTARSLTE